MLKTLKTLNRRRKMTKWCQNPTCADKKSSGQIRGNKGNKWYQSNRVGRYGYGGGNFCTLHCHDQWSNKYMSQAIDALNVRIHEPVKVNVNDAWYVDWDYERTRWDNQLERHVTVTPASYYLINKNRNIRQPIPKEQAQTPEQLASNNIWRHIDDTQARELAIQLGLAS